MNPKVVFEWKRLWFWLFALIAGFAQCWSYRYWMEADGVNYLDIANAYIRHDWSAAINSYWSPLYSWLLAITIVFVRPTPSAESTVLHLLNFVFFAGAIFCGQWFLNELIRSQKESSIPGWALWSIGSCLLLLVSLFMNSAYLDTPDLCTSALIYFAAGLLIRIHDGRATGVTYAAFGIVLALAYFSKTVMFLVAFAFLCAAGVRRRTLIAAVCFAGVALPWIAILSHAERRVTYGDAGTVNYINYVSYSGSAIHPVRTLSVSPRVQEFATPVRATYPPWYSPPYWMEGLHPHFDSAKQITVLKESFRYYLHLLGGQKDLVLGFVAILVAWPSLQAVRWHLLLPALWGFSLYALIHVEPRLVGVFFFLSWMALFSSLRVRSRPVVAGAVAVIALVTAFKIVRTEVAKRAQTENVHWRTAESLLNAGLRAEDFVAVFGHGNEGDYWAHLGGFKVVADVERADLAWYWAAPPQTRNAVIRQLQNLNVQAILCTVRPAEEDWQPIAGSPYYVRWLRPIANAAAK